MPSARGQGEMLFRPVLCLVGPVNQLEYLTRKKALVRWNAVLKLKYVVLPVGYLVLFDILDRRLDSRKESILTLHQ